MRRLGLLLAVLLLLSVNFAWAGGDNPVIPCSFYDIGSVPVEFGFATIKQYEERLRFNFYQTVDRYGNGVGFLELFSIDLVPNRDKFRLILKVDPNNRATTARLSCVGERVDLIITFQTKKAKLVL